MTQLSEFFSLEELTTTNSGLDNTPDAKSLESLKYTASQMELVRKLLQNNPITVNSGYRSPKVNKHVGGVPTSQHAVGQAVDFTCGGFGTPRKIVSTIIQSNIVYDQVICEYDKWVHISFKEKGNRRQALNIDAKGTTLFSN